jgi:hypothetical protein
MQEELEMRMLQKVIAGAAVAAAALTLGAGVAIADPPTGVTPGASSVVGVGARTTEYLLDALALKYDTENPHKTPIYSFDACQGASCAGSVVLKKGCKPISRVSISGTSNGIEALEANPPDGKTRHFCIDFVRSVRGPRSTDPTDITFVVLALENVTYASLAKGSNVPGNLTTAQLHAIYTCGVRRKGYTPNTWGALLGTKAKKGTRNTAIAPYLPQSGSEVLPSFLSAISVPVPGICVTEPATLEDNEGVSSAFTGKIAKNVLIPYSAAIWVAQYHSPECATAGCPTVNGQGVFILCKPPSKGQDIFGCDLNGVLGLNDINGTSPTSGKGAGLVSNPGFTPGFVATMYDIVRGTDSIPGYLAVYFGPKGAFCSKAYRSVITDYGFVVDPKCGVLIPG